MTTIKPATLSVRIGSERRLRRPHGQPAKAHSTTARSVAATEIRPITRVATTIVAISRTRPPSGHRRQGRPGHDEARRRDGRLAGRGEVDRRQDDAGEGDPEHDPNPDPDRQQKRLLEGQPAAAAADRPGRAPGAGRIRQTVTRSRRRPRSGSPRRQRGSPRSPRAGALRRHRARRGRPRGPPAGPRATRSWSPRTAPAARLVVTAAALPGWTVSHHSVAWIAWPSLKYSARLRVGPSTIRNGLAGSSGGIASVSATIWMSTGLPATEAVNVSPTCCWVAAR